MIELEMVTDKHYLLWMMDDWTTDELNRAIRRHRERRGFAPVKMLHNPKDGDRVSKMQTDLILIVREDKSVPQGYINLS